MLYNIRKPKRTGHDNPDVEQIETSDGKVVRATPAVAHLIGEEFTWAKSLVLYMGRMLIHTTERFPNLVDSYEKQWWGPAKEKR